MVNKKLVKEMGGVFYLTDKMHALTDMTKGTPKQALDEFCIAIDLPYQVITPNGKKYTVKATNDRIGKLYLAVLKKVDKNDLIKVTKQYYKETEYPVTIKNYFEQNIWEAALEAMNTIPKDRSSNLFEDY
jgi:hypothetical protein